jgi:transcriptional regulator with XRE-family HTH domain
METFGEWLRKHREAKGLTLYGIQKDYDFSRVTLSNIEKGKQKPSSEHLNRLAAIPKLGLSLDELLLHLDYTSAQQDQLHISEARYFPVLRSFGYLRNVFKDYKAFVESARIFSDTEPDFNPFENYLFPDNAWDFPEKFQLESTWIAPKLEIPEGVEFAIVSEQDFAVVGILTEDVVFVERKFLLRDGALVVTWKENTFAIHQVDESNGKWLLQPDNIELSSKEFKKWQSEYVIGTAVFRYGRLRRNYDDI